MTRLVPLDRELHGRHVFDWRCLPDVARYFYSSREITWEEHLRWLETLAEDDTRRHWVIEFQGRLAGSVYLTDIDRFHQRAMFGMYVADPGARLLGVGAAAELLLLDEAFGPLGLRKVSCEVFAVNVPPLRMHARMGFKTEGILRRHALCEGEWVDVHRLSLLAEEWPEIRPSLAAALSRLLSQTAPTLYSVSFR
jgi:UDP-4-amino-4,6-dideoxy-N-acetyl-beta-L-altrosamine N-acetyltransferase